jgi:hypothetical protein
MQSNISWMSQVQHHDRQRWRVSSNHHLRNYFRVWQDNHTWQLLPQRHQILTQNMEIVETYQQDENQVPQFCIVLC